MTQKSTTIDPVTGETLYPCDNCDTMRTKAEGGTVFTVCEACWDKSHPHDEKSFSITLTKDELTILQYVIPRDAWGDPLKDTYELGENEPEDPYAVLKTLNDKIAKLRWTP